MTVDMGCGNNVWGMPPALMPPIKTSRAALGVSTDTACRPDDTDAPPGWLPDDDACVFMCNPAGIDPAVCAGDPTPYVVNPARMGNPLLPNPAGMAVDWGSVRTHAGCSGSGAPVTPGPPPCVPVGCVPMTPGALRVRMDACMVGMAVLRNEQALGCTMWCLIRAGEIWRMHQGDVGHPGSIHTCRLMSSNRNRVT